MRVSRVALGFALALLCALPARADLSPAELLQQVDRGLLSVSNKVWLINMRTISTSGAVREAKMLMLQGAGERRIMRFLEPASMRNTALLTLGNGEFWVFLGQEGRTRRLGASALNQTFLGSDYTFEDLSDVYLSARYDARIVDRAGDRIRLELTPKKPADCLWSKLLLTIDSHALVRRIEYYDKSGRHTRTETRSFQRGKTQYESWVPVRMVMVNEVTKHATEMLVEVADTDRPIPDTVFSMRGLQRGDDLQFAP